MDAVPLRIVDTTPDPPAGHEEVCAFFRAAQEDFHRWSPGYNMHFGYWVPGMSVFEREPMLERMNDEVVKALGLPGYFPARAIDLGCGAGATSRSVARQHHAAGDAVTIVREQIEWAQTQSKRRRRAPHRLHALSFTETWATAKLRCRVRDRGFCYARGPAKAAAVRETARLLKPGSRLVVVDGFLAPAVRDSPAGSIATGAELGDRRARADGGFRAALWDEGFENVEIRDLFREVAPSAAHIPVVATLHTLRACDPGAGTCRPGAGAIAASWLSMVLSWRAEHSATAW
jgi:SAM-dependent methyltransferase